MRKRAYSTGAGLLLVATMLLALGLLAAQVSAAGPVLPPGFVMTPYVGGLALPTDMLFLPNGDLLVAEKGGRGETDGMAYIRLVRNGRLLPQPVAAVATNAEGDSGLLALALDPDFATNGYLYLWYATSQFSPGWSGKSVDRLARLTYDPTSGTADPASHTVILDGVLWHRWHNGGGLAFGADGLLYISTGDGGQTEHARNPGQLNGKVLRIQPTATGYTIPPGNPFVATPGARPEVFAMGLRNPFRALRHPLEGTVYVSDVGQKRWEEINRLDTPGADFGWNRREGPCNFQSDVCNPVPGFTDPYVAYPHPVNEFGSGAAVGGMAVYTGTAYPAEYQNHLFFTDYDRRFLAVVDAANGAADMRIIAGEVGNIVDLEYHRNAFYLLDVMAGTVRELRYTGSANQAPSASLAVNQVQGRPPLAVRATADAVFDPDDVVLRYGWDFGDGQRAETDVPVVEHTYVADGTYRLALQVVDGRGAASPPQTEEITVYSGAFPTVALENVSTPGNAKFRAGDVLRYSAEREGGLDGLRDEAPFVWSVELHHNEHTHPFLTDIVATSGVYTVPTENHGETTIFYRFRLDMYTEAGQVVRAYGDVLPDLVTLDLRTDPEGASLMQMDGAPQPAPAQVETLIGLEHTLEAAPTLVVTRSVYAFAHWTGPGLAAPAVTRTITLTAPAAPPTYTAHYSYTGAADLVFLPATGR